MRSRERAFPKVRFSFDLKFKFKFSSNLQCNVNLCHESFLPYNLDFSQNYETSVSGCLGVQVYWFTVYFSPMLFAQVDVVRAVDPTLLGPNMYRRGLGEFEMVCIHRS